MGKKQFLVVLVAVCLCIALFAPLALTQDKVELSFWTEFSTPNDKALIDSLVEKFNSQNPNIKVIHRAIGNEVFFSTLRTGLAGDQPPDVFQHEDYYHLAAIAAAGQCIDLTQWYETNKSRFLPEAYKAVTSNGKIWAVPLDMHSESHFYYNVDLLKKYGVSIPKTWDEFLAACQKFKDNGITPIAFGTKDGWPGKQYLEIFLVQLVGADTVWKTIDMAEGYHWNAPMFIKAAQYYQDLYDKGYFQQGCASADYPMALAYFTSGKAAFFHTGTWFLNAQMPPNFNWDFFEFPLLPEGTGDVKQIAAMFITGLSISSKSKYPDECMRFIDFMTQPEAGVAFVKAARLSALAGAINPDTASEKLLRFYKQISEATGTIAGLELCVPPAVGEDKMYNGAVAIVNGTMKAEEWMNAIEEAAQKAKANGELIQYGVK